MVISNRKKLPIELPRHEVPGTIYGMSDKGWIDADFSFTKHFLTYTPTFAIFK